MSTKFEQKPKAIGSHCKWCGNKEEDHLEDGVCPTEVINTGASPGIEFSEDVQEELRSIKAMDHTHGPEWMDEMEASEEAHQEINLAIEIAAMLPEDDQVRIDLLHGAVRIWHALNSTVAVIESEVSE